MIRNQLLSVARPDGRGRPPLRDLCPFQLGILLHQLLQTEARELYRNLGLFTVSFSLVDRPFAIFGMPHLLSGPESFLAFGLFDQRFQDVEFLSPRGKKLGNVVDGIVAASGIRWSPLRIASRPVGAALIFVLVGVMSLLLRLLGRGHSCPRGLPLSPRSSQFFHQLRRDFLEKSRRHAGLG